MPPSTDGGSASVAATAVAPPLVTPLPSAGAAVGGSWEDGSPRDSPRLGRSVSAPTEPPPPPRSRFFSMASHRSTSTISSAIDTSGGPDDTSPPLVVRNSFVGDWAVFARPLAPIPSPTQSAPSSRHSRLT